MSKYSRELKCARETAVAAGDILRRGSSRRQTIRLKGRVDLVTAIDLESEKFIIRELQRSFPHHSVLAEEGGATSRPSPYLWIIDPLDGTTNYAHGYPAFCVSIGLEVERKVVLGAVYDPIRDELFSAVRGAGAFLNRCRIHVSNQARLSQSLLATGFPYDIAESKINNLDNFARMYKKAQAIRRGGSAALDICYLACGRFDGFWELKLHPWDAAAGLVIVEEAGGRVTTIEGGKYSIYEKSILASNRKIHRQIQEVLLSV